MSVVSAEQKLSKHHVHCIALFLKIYLKSREICYKIFGVWIWAKIVYHTVKEHWIWKNTNKLIIPSIVPTKKEINDSTLASLKLFNQTDADELDYSERLSTCWRSRWLVIFEMSQWLPLCLWDMAAFYSTGTWPYHIIHARSQNFLGRSVKRNRKRHPVKISGTWSKINIYTVQRISRDQFI